MSAQNNQEYMEEDYIFEKRGGGFFGKLIALLLGFLFGIIATLGGIVGVGYYAYTKIKINDVLEAINNAGDGNIAFDQYISEEYTQGTVQNLVGDLIAVFSKEDLCLYDLVAISPYVETAGKTVEESLSKYGVDITADEFLHTPFTELSTYLMDALHGIRIGALLQGAKFEMNDVFFALCYGIEGEDYVLVDGKPQMLEGHEELTIKDLIGGDFGELLSHLPLSLLLEVDPNAEKKDAIMFSLAYGSEGIHYEIVTVEDKKEVVMLPIIYTHDGEKLYDAFQNEVACTEHEEGIYAFELNGKTVYARHDDDLAANEYRVYEDPTEQDVANALCYEERTMGFLVAGDTTELLTTLRIKDIMGDSGDSSLLAAIGDYTIQDLGKQDVVDNIKIKDLIGEGNSQIMKTLGEKTFGELKEQDVINTLKISDLLVIEENTTGILRAIQDKTIGELTDPAAFNDIKIGDIINTTETTGILSAIKDKTIGELQNPDTFNNLLLGDLIVIQTEGANKSPQILIALADTPIGNLGDRLDTLTIGEVLEGDHSTDLFMKHLQDVKLKDVTTAISTLSVQQVYEDKVYETVVDGDNYYVVDALGNRLEYKAQEGKNRYECYVIEGTDTQAYPILIGTWKYLLVDPTTKKEKDCTLNEMHLLVDNMRENMKTACIADLNVDMNLQLNDSFVNMVLLDIPKAAAGITGASKTHISDLTLLELADYIVALVNSFTNV